MTPLNIISGFHNTSIYPLDKTKLVPVEDKSSPLLSQYIPFLQPLQTPQPQSHFHIHVYQSTPPSTLGHSQLHSINITPSPLCHLSPSNLSMLISLSRMSCYDSLYNGSRVEQ